jgi:hypothetical protein
MFMILAYLFLGCSVRDVRPGADGVHMVTFTTDEKQDSTRFALRQAKRYCKKQKMNFAIINESFKYVCDMPEDEYIRKKKLAEAAQIAGSTASITSEENSKQDILGTMVATGGAIAEHSLGDCYELKMTFQCL